MVDMDITNKTITTNKTIIITTGIITMHLHYALLHTITEKVVDGGAEAVQTRLRNLVTHRTTTMVMVMVIMAETTTGTTTVITTVITTGTTTAAETTMPAEATTTTVLTTPLRMRALVSLE